MKPTTDAQTVCADCGSACIPSGCSAGYATLGDGKRVCYSCADARQRKDLLDRSKPFYAYLSCDGARVTTWTGGALMTVSRSRPCKLTRQSFTHDRNSFQSVHAVDIHGGHWHGRGSAGICITMRPCKG